MYEQRRRATHLLCSRAQQSFELVDLGENGIELLLCFQEPNERYWNGVVVNNIVCGWHIYIYLEHPRESRWLYPRDVNFFFSNGFFYHRSIVLAAVDEAFTCVVYLFVLILLFLLGFCM